MPDAEQVAKEHRERGMAYFEAGDFRAAIAEFNRAIHTAPDSRFVALAFYHRGLAYAALKELSRAIADYTAAIRQDHTFLHAYFSRGDLYAARGDYESALHDFDRVLELHTQYIQVLPADSEQVAPLNRLALETHLSRANAYAALDNLTQAIEELSEVLRVETQHLDACFSRAVLREKVNDLAGALSDFEHYLAWGGGVRYGDQAQVEQKIAELQAQLGQANA